MKINKYIAALLMSAIFVSCSSSEEPPAITPLVLVVDVEKLEGDQGTLQIDYVVRLNEAINNDLTLTYATEDASAFQGLDYTKASGQVVIPAGSTEATFSLSVVSDLIKEGNEFFRLRFDSETDVEYSKSFAEIKIKNDDQQLPYDTEDYSTPASYEGWTLAWADEFDGPSINTDWWTHEIGRGDNGWGNNELQYYTADPENSRIEDGKLIIEAREDAVSGSSYTSARMITKDKKSFGYSRVDIRAKAPFGQGIWPALWMLGNSIDDKGWPACGEIDIMELVGHQPSTTHSTVHFGTDFPANHKFIGEDYRIAGEIFNDRFHVFSVVREQAQMWFYVDDILIFTFTSRDTQGQPYPFNEQFFFIMNIAVGGNWPGSPDATTQFPQFMEVDYVRVFEKNANF